MYTVNYRIMWFDHVKSTWKLLKQFSFWYFYISYLCTGNLWYPPRREGLQRLVRWVLSCSDPARQSTDQSSSRSTHWSNLGKHFAWFSRFISIFCTFYFLIPSPYPLFIDAFQGGDHSLWTATWYFWNLLFYIRCSLPNGCSPTSFCTQLFCRPFRVSRSCTG